MGSRRHHHLVLTGDRQGLGDKFSSLRRVVSSPCDKSMRFTYISNHG